MISVYLLLDFVGAVVISVGRCGACVYVYENVKRYNVKTTTRTILRKGS